MYALTALDTALLAMAYLLAKHMVADYMLQTPYQWMNKGRYGHPGGLLHVAIHLAMTVPVFAILAPATPTTAGAILGGEALIHYHMDWIKENLGKALKLQSNGAGFWRLHGLDQLVHGLTYVGIVWLLPHAL